MIRMTISGSQTVPPFQQKRDAAARLRLMHEMFLPRAEWILSGSLQGWGDSIIPYFDLVVFLYMAKDVRLRRLRAREATRFGTDAVAAGGWRHRESEDFIDWASQYDDGDRVSRTLEKHQIWLAALPGPTLRLDGARTLPELIAEIRAAIS